MSGQIYRRRQHEKIDTPREVFGLAITELRVRRRESQATVAPRVGCEEFYLRNIEQGKENLSFDLMYAIVDYFGMLPLSRFWNFAEGLAEIRVDKDSPVI